GAGFFDPGTSFPNHISASVNGGGVTVNSVTYNNPTNITATLTIAANAAPGARTITVINPDSQSATSSPGILTIAGVISPTNQPPTLAAISNRTVSAGTTLTVTNVAGDPDGDQLTFSLGAGAAINATINASNGLFTWTPMQSQAGTNHFNVIVTDNGSPPLSATQTFAVTVIATNTPPTLAPVADRTIHALMTLTITNSASDPDVGETLSFSLDAGAPTGASIGAANGVFVWTPDESRIGTNDITVRVTDNGVPPLSAAQSFAVVVEPRPILTIGLTNGIVTLTWSAIAGLNYQPQFETNLTDNVWTAFPSNVLAAGPITSTTDTNGANTNLFYRIFVVP
ncbi:MAG TPA: putative Ig domain-containing protein, partial [Verrucomicrobiae bacterium]|nr:putative Ig domain-containing protein [Verrucomicrobiae bacterium]